MWLLATLVTLLCMYAPVCGAEGCNGFRHLENGQTFFRYGGLLVIFRCHPGYKLHGYKTNSCVSGHWSRDPPVCVGSGCSNPGPLTSGTSSMNGDGSWAVFSCNSGFKLHGPSVLYCKGHMWNSTKPVCKESDMMSSVSHVSMQKPNVQTTVAVKTLQQSHYDTLTNAAAEEANLKFHSSLSTPSRMSKSEGIKATNPKVYLQQHTESFLNLKAKDQRTTHHEGELQEATQEAEAGTGRHGSESNLSHREAEKVEKVTQMFASKSHQSTTVSSTVPLVSGTERSTSSPPSFPAAQTPAVSAVMPALPGLGKEKAVNSGGAVTPKGGVAPSEVITSSSQTADGDQQAENGFQYPPFAHGAETSASSTSVYFASPTASSAASSALSSSPPLPTASPSTSSSPSSTRSPDVKTQLLTAASPANSTPPTEPRSPRTEPHSLTSDPPRLSLYLSRRPTCPYPPVPAHGTFHFGNVENPGPREYKHYIQYACYPGYTLAYGDVHSYCQQGGTWSGITPVCLELTPCSINNGGCSQLCSHSQHYNQSTNQTFTSSHCHCRPGFTLLDDGQTCRDVDECVEEQHPCKQRCINVFGSFKCSCDKGYQPTHDQTSCTDVDECLLPAAVTGCVFGCVNTPGSFHCQCPAGYSLQTEDSHCQDIDECAVDQGLRPCMEHCHNSPGSYRCSCTYGHILAGDGHGCIAECPPGYRKQPTTPENSTAQALREECVDINECLEEICEWQCVNLPGSYRCICPKGYTLQNDGRRCKDINECNRKNGGCSHLCVNQKGGHKCACPASHRLSPYSWKKCVPRTTANTAG